MTHLDAIHLFTQPSIAESFPLMFSNGSRWESYTGVCLCGCEIRATEIFGSVTPTFKDVYKIEAVGMCPQCRQVTAFTHTLGPDRVMTRNEDGNWVTCEAQSQGKNALSRLVQLVVGWFERMKR